jgi:hypothetical protein
MKGGTGKEMEKSERAERALLFLMKIGLFSVPALWSVPSQRDEDGGAVLAGGRSYAPWLLLLGKVCRSE